MSTEKKFLFIARKDDSADYCRGCLMASYSSDFEIRNHLTREELVKLWAEYLYKNLNTRINESGYEFHIFNKGVQVYKDDYASWDGGEQYDNPEYQDKYDELEVIEREQLSEIAEIESEAKALAKQKKDEEVREEARKQQERNRLAQIAAEQAKRKQYEQLKQEFENKGTCIKCGGQVPSVFNYCPSGERGEECTTQTKAP